MPPSPRTVEIIGGGLAGLSLGLGLRRHGIPVTIREAGRYPRHRVCGEFITGLGAETIRALGMDEIFAHARPAETVAWFDRRGGILRRRLPGRALCLSRHRLDQHLAARFEQCGGDLRTNERASATPLEGRVLACGRKADSRSRLVGLKQHFHGLELAADLEMHLGRGTYVGLTRVEDGAVNVCGLFRHEGGPCRLIAKIESCGLEALARRLAEAQAVEDSGCAVAALDYRPGGTRNDGLLLGDHGGLIPPFTGNGMTVAFQSAAAALEPLCEWAEGRRTWFDTVAAARANRAAKVASKTLLARLLHPVLLHPGGQFLMRQFSRSGLLPFDTVFRLLH
jgi:flavin-dependent dehydrogenase